MISIRRGNILLNISNNNKEEGERSRKENENLFGR